jgi:hypothetical protein
MGFHNLNHMFTLYFTNVCKCPTKDFRGSIMQLHHWSSKVKKLREYVRYPIENLVFARLKSSQNMWENEDLKKNN